jgi:hypothetical protein
LLLRQPENVANHRQPPVGDRESQSDRLGNRYGSGP